MSKKVFISYGEEDYETAKRLYDDLKVSGFNPWIDREAILPGRNKEIEVCRAIRESSYFLVLLSGKSLSVRGYFHKELKTALKIFDEMPPSGIFILPVRLDACELAYENLQGIQHTDLFPSYEEGLRQIVRALESPSDEKESHRFVDKRFLEKLVEIRIEGGVNQYIQKAKGSVLAGRIELNFYQDRRLWLIVIALVCLIPALIIFIKPNVTYNGISPEQFHKLSQELGVTKSALKSFFKILEKEQVSPEDLDSTLREIAKRYLELKKKAEELPSDDSVVADFKQMAEDALEAGEFDQAEKLLNQAVERLKEITGNDLLSVDNISFDSNNSNIKPKADVSKEITGNYLFPDDNSNVKRETDVSHPNSYSGNLQVSKAIIVASGLRERDILWPIALSNANFAYRSLRYRGFADNTIFYLASKTTIDLDDNGVFDVDGYATRDNLKYAVTSWAQDADNLIIYLVGHGNKEIFLISNTERLHSTDLDFWIDSLQTKSGNRVILIYDSSMSGSFIPRMIPPQGKERIVITSSKRDEYVFFSEGGTLSFSYQFWTSVLEGNRLNDAFSFAAGMMETRQTALVDANGDGIAENKDIKLLENIIIGSNECVQTIGNLMWQACKAKSMRWDSVKNFVENCKKDSFLGYNDWRLPTLAELQMLKQHMKKDHNIQWQWYWSAEEDLLTVWCVNFGYGKLEDKNFSMLSKGNAAVVRLVRDQ